MFRRSVNSGESYHILVGQCSNQWPTEVEVFPAMYIVQKSLATI